MLPFIVCPATCELCGHWLPEHQTSCPRNGVHPSQWNLLPPTMEVTEEQVSKEQDTQLFKEL
ncbi:uncharacterized protein B0P05DRAFT_484153 [Gilbertella persicaria]|uniref:uncharacterized protein n=1 Tax=Gilbertella persicaria TaxID=101096 RepID=UPI00222105BA|nr:uncharacterized protein B0P05DRAFT_484153 [Gilbertella persicaria]KAI8092182.1 hypothetical protein B0P05DRAFT_484153 [Gilbertella persicaria]